MVEFIFSLSIFAAKQIALSLELEVSSNSGGKSGHHRAA